MRITSATPTYTSPMPATRISSWGIESRPAITRPPATISASARATRSSGRLGVALTRAQPSRSIGPGLHRADQRGRRARHDRAHRGDQHAPVAQVFEVHVPHRAGGVAGCALLDLAGDHQASDDEQQHRGQPRPHRAQPDPAERPPAIGRQQHAAPPARAPRGSGRRSPGSGCPRRSGAPARRPARSRPRCAPGRSRGSGGTRLAADGRDPLQRLDHEHPDVAHRQRHRGRGRG